MRRDTEYLLDMLESARLALSYISGKTQEEFLKDSQSQDAVVRRLEIIGEAARRISSETQQQFSLIPWHTIIGMRNRMIHEYNDVDLFIVWATVLNELPTLITLLEPLIPSEELS